MVQTNVLPWGCMSHLADPHSTSRRLLWCLLTSCADKKKYRRKDITENQSRSIHGNMRSYWECQEVRENHPGETWTTFLRLANVTQDRPSCFVLYLTNPWGYQIFCVIHTVQSRLDKCFPSYFFSLSGFFNNYWRIFWEELMFIVLFR